MAIYKYVAPERLDILMNANIRFTQPAAFNDPFECFPYFETIAPEKDIDDFLKKDAWDEKKIDRMLEESWKTESIKSLGVSIPFDIVKDQMKAMMSESKPVICDIFRGLMTLRTSPARDITLSALMEAMNKEIGIVSLTEKRDNLLMWAHYSSNHTGFVIEFDENHPFFDQRKNEKEIRGHLKKVRYSIDRPQIALLDQSLSEEENLDKWIKDILYPKVV